jgi:hypothetical protein
MSDFPSILKFLDIRKTDVQSQAAATAGADFMKPFRPKFTD